MRDNLHKYHNSQIRKVKTLLCTLTTVLFEEFFLDPIQLVLISLARDIDTLHFSKITRQITLHTFFYDLRNLLFTFLTFFSVCCHNSQVTIFFGKKVSKYFQNTSSLVNIFLSILNSLILKLLAESGNARFICQQTHFLRFQGFISEVNKSLQSQIDQKIEMYLAQRNLDRQTFAVQIRRFRKLFWISNLINELKLANKWKCLFYHMHEGLSKKYLFHLIIKNR